MIIFSAGLRRKLFHEIAVLFQVEILSDTVLAAECNHVAPQFLLVAGGSDLSHVGSSLSGVPVGGVHALLQRVGMQVDALCAAVRADDASLDGCVAGGQVGCIANLRSQMDAA